MADYVQTLNKLASASSIDHLKLDKQGQLEKRSALSTLGHKIMNAFRSLSEEGRMSITARNGELLSAMQNVVDASKRHEVFIVRETSTRLAASLNRLQSNVDRTAYHSQIKNSITGDPRFEALPADSKAALRQALTNMANANFGAKPSEWKSVAASLKWAFFGELPADLDLGRGIGDFADGLKEGFLKPKMQAHIKDGFNQTTLMDFRRGAIRQIGDIATPPGQSDEFYKDALASVMLWHEELMPFVSTMITQNGMGTVAQFLPAQSGHNIYKDLILCNTGKFTQLDNVTITREGDELVVNARYDDGFHTDDPQTRDKSAFCQQSTVTMRIDLASEPERHMVNGKEVLIPRFRLENISTGFNNPVDIVKNDPRFQPLPQYSQDALLKSLHQLYPDTARMEALKNDFFGIVPAGYDEEQGKAGFCKEMKDGFLIQQHNILKDGFHNNMANDLRRGSVKSINGQPVQRNQSDEYFKDMLRRHIPERHHRFMPFISMMLTQAGLDCAKVFLPAQLGLSDANFSRQLEGGLVTPKGYDDHDMEMNVAGSVVTLKENFGQRFVTVADPDSKAIPLAMKGTVTMVIDLDAEPELHMIGGKEVLVPQFRLEEAKAHFGPGEANFSKA